MRVENKHIDDIMPYHRNPRTHDKSIEHLKESIKSFGFKVPLVVDDEGTIIMGHGRYEAVRQLMGEIGPLAQRYKEEGREGLASALESINEGTVPVIRESELSEKEKKELRIADNAIADKSAWDLNLLTFELRELSEEVIGFDTAELERMLGDPGDLSFEKYDPGEIESFGESFEDRYGAGTKERMADLISLICPHCGEEFSVNKNELDLFQND